MSHPLLARRGFWPAGREASQGIQAPVREIRNRPHPLPLSRRPILRIGARARGGTKGGFVGRRFLGGQEGKKIETPGQPCRALLSRRFGSEDPKVQVRAVEPPGRLLLGLLLGDLLLSSLLGYLLLRDLLLCDLLGCFLLLGHHTSS